MSWLCLFRLNTVWKNICSSGVILHLFTISSNFKVDKHSWHFTEQNLISNNWCLVQQNHEPAKRNMKKWKITMTTVIQILILYNYSIDQKPRSIFISTRRCPNSSHQLCFPISLYRYSIISWSNQLFGYFVSPKSDRNCLTISYLRENFEV